MPNKIALYPTYSLEDARQPFDHSFLPFRITQEVPVEDVSAMFNADRFAWARNHLGERHLADLQGVRYAITHRYQTETQAEGRTAGTDSEVLVKRLAACLGSKTEILI